MAEPASVPTKLLLVTGMSGAGKSSALKMLEDFGYEAIDNLPLSLLGPIVREIGSGGGDARRPLAIGVDVRTHDFGVDPFLGEIQRLEEGDGVDVHTLFMDCDDEVLVRRYTETRRRHPLASDRPIPDVIRLERRMLMRLRDRADMVLDTTHTTLWEFKELLQARFGLETGVGLSLFVTSFSFRQGLPREADLVFDVRFLKNPHYDPALRPLTGRDAPVQEAIRKDPDFERFLDSLKGMIDITLPRYASEGKSYLTIAIGCTGGRHRSVFLAETLAAWLGDLGRPVHLHHRDVHRDSGRDMR